MSRHGYAPIAAWFTREWWGYLLRKPAWAEAGYCGWIARIWCRMRGHPSGPVWYNVGGLEPNPHCKECGDYLL